MPDNSDAIKSLRRTTNITSTLAAKLLKVVLGIYLSLAISVTVIQLFLEYENEERRLAVEITSAANTFGPILSQALWNIDEDQVQAALKGLLGINPDITEVRLLSPEEDIAVYRFRSPRLLDLLKDQSQNAPGAEELFDSFHFSFKLSYSSEYTTPQPVGTLVLSSNTNVVLQRAAHTFFITIVSAIFKTCFLWVIFYVIMQRMVARPLNQVTRSMAQLHPNAKAESPNTEFDNDLLARDDELGIMIRTFKDMEMALNEKNRALRVYQMGLEEKVHERTEQLEKASQAKTDFLAAMSHEIRTPMNGVLGMTQLLVDTPLNEKQLKYVKVIQNSSESLIDIINGILDHLKIEAGKIELEHTVFDLESILDDCTAIFTYKSQESKIRMIPVFKPNCPSWVSGDPTRVRQIIINLLGNAFKFTREGEIILSAEKIKDLDSDQVVVRISVRDTGIGIAEDKQDRLFNPFSQADNSTTRRYGGTGLGLSICKQLTEIMGGTIGFSSTLGEGSTFWVELPFTLAEKYTKDSVKSAKTPTQLQNKKLLVIDDHSAFLDVTRELAESWGMRTRCISHGEGVLEDVAQAIAKGAPYDVAIVDVALPDISGIELCEKLHERFQAQTPKIILVTAYQQSRSYTDLEKFGVISYIEKPISNKELRIALSNAVDAQCAQTEAAENTQPLHQFEHLNVLVAEDNQVNQMVIQGFLNKLGVYPTIAENGLQAIQACRDNAAFDLILMDCEMPELDGWEASRQIRSLDYRRQNGTPVKIYALSAHAMERYLEKSKQSGMDGYLYKPVTIKQIQNVLLELDRK